MGERRAKKRDEKGESEREKLVYACSSTLTLSCSSPNNALLNVEPTDELRRFWIFVRDGNRVEITLNVLLVKDIELDQLGAALAEVARAGEQSLLLDLFTALATREALAPLLALFATFVPLDM